MAMGEVDGSARGRAGWLDWFDIGSQVGDNFSDLAVCLGLGQAGRRD